VRGLFFCLDFVAISPLEFRESQHWCFSINFLSFINWSYPSALSVCVGRAGVVLTCWRCVSCVRGVHVRERSSIA